MVVCDHNQVSNLGDEEKSQLYNVLLLFDNVSFVMIIVIGIVALVGNYLAIYVILRFPNMRNTLNIYILNLSLAHAMYAVDFFVFKVPLLGVVFLSTPQVTWPFGIATCKLHIGIENLSKFAASCFVVAMVAERCLSTACLERPASICSPLASKIVCVIVWFIVIGSSTPVVLFAELDSKHQCTIHWPSNSAVTGLQSVALFNFFLNFFGPMFVCCIFCYAALMKKPDPSQEQCLTEEERELNNTRTKIVLAVFITYIICKSPYYGFYMFTDFPPKNFPCVFIHIISISTVLIDYLFLAVNPILYFIMNGEFRNAACCCGSADISSNNSAARDSDSSLPPYEAPEETSL